MRLIDADRLKEVFRRNTGYDYADIIDMQPTVNVLDKIRAEIEVNRWTDKDIRIERNALASGLDKALEIIDKYREVNE